MMDIMTILGYGSMVILGVVLGFLGAGGSILNVPILVYLLSVPATQATGYSLVIVGTSALVAALEYFRCKQTDLRMAFIFGSPTILGVYLTRRYLFPAVPDPVFSLYSATLSKDTFIMLFFAVLMLMAAVSMIWSNKNVDSECPSRSGDRVNYPFIFVAGFCVGVLIGFVGAGGGFMILPGLVFLGGIPMRIAVGTSLVIIAANSLIGFLGEIQASIAIDYGFLGTIIALPLVGIVIGTQLNKKFSAGHLKAVFGWFVLVMGILVILKESLL